MSVDAPGHLSKSAPLPNDPKRDTDHAASRLRAFYESHERTLLGLVTIVLVLGFWQLVSDRDWVRPSFISSPTLIWHALVSYYGQGGTGWSDLWVSGQEFGWGFLISVVVGIPVGILIGWSARLDALLSPIVIFLNTSPRIALAPLFVIWFGVGESSKVWVIVLCAIVPIITSARAGVATIEPALVAMSRSYGSSGFRVLRTVVLPGSVPSISSGVRLGIGQALLGMVLAEYIASSAGLGYQVVTSAANFDTDRLFAVVVVISVLGMIVTGLLTLVERYFERWRTG